ncbi:MAG: ATP-binding cassette domain-containing protein [Rubrivivax sp.]|nr:ATP-binding cassette domain-containing protein [Rubrivivax sp.]
MTPSFNAPGTRADGVASHRDGTRSAADGPVPLLVAHDLRVVLGGRPVLDGLCLDVMPGCVHALLGPNGSGKSSVAYTLMGCSGYAPETGSVSFAGEPIDGLPLHERARRGMALAWQEPARFEGLSVTDFLSLGAKELDVTACLSRVGLKPQAYVSRSLDNSLSGGERKRIELAGVLALNPRLAILDEPTAGIDLLSMTDVMSLIATLKRDGASVLLITHQEGLAEHADRASQLCGGRIVRNGAPAEVIEHYKSRVCERCDGQRCGHG